MNEIEKLKIALFDTIMEMDRLREELSKKDIERQKLLAQYTALMGKAA